MDRDIQGTIDMEMPLASRHVTAITYGLKNRAALTNGHCIVNYNGNQVLQGQYNSKSESRDGFEKDIVDITLQNEKLPLGISYTHEQLGSETQLYVSTCCNIKTFTGN